MDLNRNPFLSKKELEDRIATEALASSVESLGTDYLFPAAIKYSIKTFEKGENMKSFFTEQIKTFQVYESCKKYTKYIKLLLPAL